MRPIVRMLPLLGLALAACSSAPLPPSSVSGSLVLASFPEAPTAVRATDEIGTIASSPLDAAGAFRLSLAIGHSYRLDVVSAVGTTPIVFPRALGRLDTTFRVSTLGAVVALGSVRRMDVAAPTTFALLSASDPADGADGADGECVDGYLAGTTTPCIDDDGDVTCVDDGEDGEEDDDGEVADAPDGECVDGIDATTGAACIDEENEIDDAPAGPVALPEHNVPDDVDGCGDGDGEHED